MQEAGPQVRVTQSFTTHLDENRLACKPKIRQASRRDIALLVDLAREQFRFEARLGRHASFARGGVSNEKNDWQGR